MGYRFSTTLCLDTGLNTLHSYVRYLLFMRCYSMMDVVVGTRFHSVVLSLMSGTPAVAIEHEHKARGIMRDLGLESWVLSITGLDSNLLMDKVCELVQGRDNIMAQIGPRISQLYEDAPWSLDAALGST